MPPKPRPGTVDSINPALPTGIMYIPHNDYGYLPYQDPKLWELWYIPHYGYLPYKDPKVMGIMVYSVSLWVLTL